MARSKIERGRVPTGGGQMNNDLVAKLRKQLTRVTKLDFYRDKYRKAGIDHRDLKTMDDFRQIPYTDSKDIERDMFETHPPFGSLFPKQTTRMNFTPSGKGLMLVPNTANDIRRMNEANASTYGLAGLEAKDTLLLTFSHHLFAAGSQIQGACERLGAKVISTGPGETERTLDIINRFRVNALYTNPSFAIKLAGMGMRGIKVLFGGGEPFSSVQGYKQKVRSAVGSETILIDTYALSHSMPTARECRYETGLHVVNELVYLEIIDPETGRVLQDGERGEIVITHLHKEAMPLYRYRTGDISMLKHIKCLCGCEETLPLGVFGRVDNMVKVKGVKVYPSQISLVLRTYPELSEKPYRLKISNKESGGELLALEIKAEASKSADLLRRHLKEILLINVDELRFVKEMPEGPLIEDCRWG